MTREHLDAVLPHEHEMFGSEAWTRSSYLDEITDTRLRRYRVSTDEHGTLLGWGGIMVVAGTAQLLTIGTVPAAQRQGVATELLHDLYAQAIAMGASECLLEVRIDNAPARAFYDREGFTALRVRRGYYDNGRVDAVEMRKELAA